MATYIGSRDLSEVFERSLEVTILGIGTETTDFINPQTLATHTACIFTKFTGQALPHLRPSDAPWKLISLNRQTKQLIVGPV